MELIERLDAARERWNLLQHPFYRRWSCGELTREELSRYAGEYRHAVVALAGTAAKASVLAGSEHAREEAAHVGLWDDFAAAFDADSERAPSAETEECVAAWAAPNDPLEALAVLYAVESGQPEVSRAKRDGLAEHYGVAEDQPGAAYFVLHAERDREHSAEARRLLEAHAHPEDADRLVEVGEAALRGNWRLLDGVDS